MMSEIVKLLEETWPGILAGGFIAWLIFTYGVFNMSVLGIEGSLQNAKYVFIILGALIGMVIDYYAGRK